MRDRRLVVALVGVVAQAMRVGAVMASKEALEAAGRIVGVELARPAQRPMNLDWTEWNEAHRGEGGGGSGKAGGGKGPDVTVSGGKVSFRVGGKKVSADLDPSDLDDPNRHADVARDLKDNLRDAGIKISGGEAKAVVVGAYEARALADPVKSVPVLANRVFGKKGTSLPDGSVSWSKKGGSDDAMRAMTAKLKGQGFKKVGDTQRSNANNAEYEVEQWAHASGAKATTQIKTSYVGQGANGYFVKIKPGA